MNSAYAQLEQAFNYLKRLEHMQTILQWDTEVMMPAGGAPARAEAEAELAAMSHAHLCRPEMSQWLQQAQQQSDLEPSQRANLTEMHRLWQNANVLPEALVREQSAAISHCQMQWRVQRANNDWQGFSENFKPVVTLARQQAAIRRDALGAATAYDALLGLFSHGDTSDLIQSVFDRLKAELPGLIAEVVKSQPRNATTITGDFAVARQRALSEKIMTWLGFDFDRGRLDVSTHPFSTGNPGDQRITTRFADDDFIEALYATVHETGHASYEAGLPEAWRSQPVGQARNMSIHESQSLFFEKHLGGEPAFCQRVAELANELLQPSPVLTGEWVRQSVCRVAPGYIRVHADELTYPLHIVLRYEIESALINGELEVDDIPLAWHDKMTEYLGLATGDNHRDGCLQDVHWPSGAFGYFPSYTLGAVNAAQFRAAMERDLGPVDEVLQSGSIEPIRQWLSQHVWQRASFVSSQEIVTEATGSGTDAEYLLAHFQRRYLR